MLLNVICSTFAVCLDGTLPGYHIHRGSGSGANSWLIQLEVWNLCFTWIADISHPCRLSLLCIKCTLCLLRILTSLFGIIRLWVWIQIRGYVHVTIHWLVVGYVSIISHYVPVAGWRMVQHNQVLCLPQNNSSWVIKPLWEANSIYGDT